MKSFGLIVGIQDLILLSRLRFGSRSVIVDPLIDTYKLYDPIQALDATKSYIDILSQKGITQCIVWPRYEYYLRSDPTYRDRILPLYQTYLDDYVLRYTLVGKLWFRWDRQDIVMINEMIRIMRATFQPNPLQSRIHKFHHDLPIRTVCADLQKNLIVWWCRKQRILSNIVKTDLHRLKDADIDTLVPLQYCYRHNQKILRHRFCSRKRRFHWVTDIQSIIQMYIGDQWWFDVHCMHTTDMESIALRPYYSHQIRYHTHMTYNHLSTYFAMIPWTSINLNPSYTNE